MAWVIWLEKGKVLDVTSVDVLFVFFLQLFQNFIEILYFFLTGVEDFFQDVFTLSSKAEEGENLVDNVGLGIFLGVLKD